MIRSILIACFMVCSGLAVAQEGPVERARAALEAGNPSRAMEILEAEYSSIKENVDAVALLADCALQSGAFDSGISYSLRVIALAPDRLDGHRIAAQSFYWRAEEAKTEPSSTSARVNGFYEESVTSCTEYLKRDPKNLDIWNLKGHAFYWLERHKESAEAFEAAAKLDPKSVDILSNLARAYGLAKDDAKMSATMDRAMTLDPQNGALNLSKAQFLAASGTPEAMAAAADACAAGLKKRNVTWETGNGSAGFILNAYGKDGSWDKAVAAMDGWVKAHPEDGAAWWWHGDTLFRAGQVDKAAQSFEKSWKVSRESLASSARSVGHCYWRLACPLNEKNEPDYRKADKALASKAFQWFAKAQAVRNWDWAYAGSEPVTDMFNLFIGLQANGHLDYAVQEIEKTCLPSAPESWMLLNILGLYYRDAGGAAGGAKGKEWCAKSAQYYESASRSVLADANASGPQKAQILNDTGLLFHFPQYQINDLEKGMEYYRKALSHDANYIDANENFAICLNALGKHEEAIPYLETVLKAEPGRRVSRNQLEIAKRGLKKD